MTGSAARQQAQDRFARIVSTITSAQNDTFYTRPAFTGFPGLCAADAYSFTAATPESGTAGSVERRKVYQLIGSTEAPAPDGAGFVSARSPYRASVTANCKARRASKRWFSGDGDQEVWTALHTVDGVIAGLQSHAPLPFRIKCNGRSAADCAETRAALASSSIKELRIRILSYSDEIYVIRSIQVDLPTKTPPMLISVALETPYGPASVGKEARTIVRFSEIPPPPQEPAVAQPKYSDR